MSDAPQKPLYERPQLYAHYFGYLKGIAKHFGYNLILHGSMNRDFDLVAIPWVDDPQDEFDLVNAINEYMTGHVTEKENKETVYLYKELPGGRHSYVINLNRGGYRDGVNAEGLPNYTPDPQYYLDISFTPFNASLLQQLETLRTEKEEAEKEIAKFRESVMTEYKELTREETNQLIEHFKKAGWYDDEFIIEIDRLKAEAERLREALREIVNTSETYHVTILTHAETLLDKIEGIAKSALQP